MVARLCANCGRWAASRGERGLVGTNAGYSLIPVWAGLCGECACVDDKRFGFNMPAMTEAPEKAGLIRNALGSGLQGLLPGQNHKHAIASWRSTTWHGSKGCGEVTKAGIAWYPDTVG